MKRIKLKNREDKYALVDDHVFQDIESNDYLRSIDLLNNLREHSKGYVIFQRYIRGEVKPTYETIYLHHYVAEKFVQKPDVSGKKLYVRFKNGDPLDVRLENLEWVTLSVLRRHQNHSNSIGYRGVFKQKKRYTVVIYINNEKHDLGSFDTPEEAARAYNKKSREVFGETKSLNQIKEK